MNKSKAYTAMICVILIGLIFTGCSSANANRSEKAKLTIPGFAKAIVQIKSDLSELDTPNNIHVELGSYVFNAINPDKLDNPESTADYIGVFPKDTSDILGYKVGFGIGGKMINGTPQCFVITVTASYYLPMLTDIYLCYDPDLPVAKPSIAGAISGPVNYGNNTTAKMDEKIRQYAQNHPLYGIKQDNWIYTAYGTVLFMSTEYPTTNGIEPPSVMNLNKKILTTIFNALKANLGD